MSIRVLHIIPTLVRGGAEKQLTLLTTGLPKPEFDVHICVLTHTGPYEEILNQREMPIHFIDKRWKVDPAAYFRLSKVVKSLQPDIVHTWIFAANCYGRQAAWRSGVKVILAGERCVDPWKRGYEFAIDRYLAKRTTKIVTNSAGVRDFYAAHGIASEKFAIIPNGVTPPKVSSGSRQALLDELHLPHDSQLIVAVGRLWPQKRYKDLIWAADLLKCVREDVHFLIIGDGPERERLTRFRDLVEIGDHVHFLGERSDVGRILQHAVFLWLGSSYEGQSNAVLEAMSLGLPVIATDIPGNRDLVVPEETGYLVPVGDRAAFARWSKVLLEQPELARRLGDTGRQRVISEFNVEKMVERHATLYRGLHENK